MNKEALIAVGAVAATGGLAYLLKRRQPQEPALRLYPEVPPGDVCDTTVQDRTGYEELVFEADVEYYYPEKKAVWVDSFLTYYGTCGGEWSPIKHVMGQFASGFVTLPACSGGVPRTATIEFAGMCNKDSPPPDAAAEYGTIDDCKGCHEQQRTFYLDVMIKDTAGNKLCRIGKNPNHEDDRGCAVLRHVPETGYVSITAVRETT
ncbi:MAG: hypothetical protein PHZ19_02250 [Candidatus Thermoplasmatota archaeon]|nr:hypothetical protein [Candidatus Thermoplasmatota archaeon]